MGTSDLKKGLRLYERLKVCELHFNEKDIVKCSKYEDERTGRLFEVPLLNWRFSPNAIPTLFISQLSYLPVTTQKQHHQKKKLKLILGNCEKSCQII